MLRGPSADFLQKDADRIRQLESRLRYELSEHRCGVCFKAFLVDLSKIPASVRYECEHGPLDLGCEKIVADFRSRDGV